MHGSSAVAFLCLSLAALHPLDAQETKPKKAAAVVDRMITRDMVFIR